MGEQALLVADINLGKRYGVSEHLINFNNRLYVSATDRINGYELWALPVVPEPSTALLSLSVSSALLRRGLLLKR